MNFKIEGKFITFPLIEEKYKKYCFIKPNRKPYFSQVKSQYEQNPYPKWDRMPCFHIKLVKEYLSLKKINFMKTSNQ